MRTKEKKRDKEIWEKKSQNKMNKSKLTEKNRCNNMRRWEDENVTERIEIRRGCSKERYKWDKTMRRHEIKLEKTEKTREIVGWNKERNWNKT